jgi:type III secretion protein J
LAVDGVHSARVHLNLPVAEAFARTTSKASASVLLEHRGPTPPLGSESVQKIVAGSVQNLAPADVSVVFVPRTPRTILASERLAHVGPIAVSRGSLRTVQIAAGIALGVILLLASTCLVLLLRVSRLRRELDEREADKPAAPPRPPTGGSSQAMHGMPGQPPMSRQGYPPGAPQGQYPAQGR